MRGVSASVMTGQHGYFGTGCFNLVLDMKEMQNMDDNEVDMKKDNEEIEKIFGNMEDKTDSCSKNKVEIRNNLSAIKKEDMGDCGNDGYDIGF
jgi:hypothetical protein